MADRFGYGEIGLDINPCRGREDYEEPNGCKSNGGCGVPTMNDDYISREAVETFLRSRNYCLDTDADIEYVVECLRKEIPAADVQPVVYCKDCRLSRENGFFCTSTFHGGMTFPNDFCSLGERREGGTP